MTCLCRGQASNRFHTAEVNYSISNSDSQDFPANHLPNKDILLSSAQSSFLIIEEGGGGITAFARNQHNYEQNHSAKKMPFKHIKNGKTIDVHQHPFIKNDISFTSGILSKDRYLFVIQKLRI